jgi:hypothetical protein
MRYFATIFSFLILICGCAKSQNYTPKSLRLTMKMDTMIAKPCIDYTVYIEPNGKTVVSKDCFSSEENQTFESNLSENQMKEIVQEINKSNFFSFEDEYSYYSKNCTNLSTDSPTVTLTINLDGKEKTIKHYFGCFVKNWFGDENALQPLSSLESKIDEIVGIKQ